jgi:hypothetical protein
MKSQQAENLIPLDVFTYPVDIFTCPSILSGHVSCTPGLRLLDFLNNVGQDPDVGGEFLEVVDAADSGFNNQEHVKTFVKKTAIELVSVSDANMARGAGDKEGEKPHQFVRKSPVQVSLQLPTYVIISKMHYAEGQCVMDVLNDETLFLPLTDVKITYQNRLFATRPFVAVNKRMIISLKEERY